MLGSFFLLNMKKDTINTSSFWYWIYNGLSKSPIWSSNSSWLSGSWWGTLMSLLIVHNSNTVFFPRHQLWKYLNKTWKLLSHDPLNGSYFTYNKTQIKDEMIGLFSAGWQWCDGVTDWSIKLWRICTSVSNNKAQPDGFHCLRATMSPQNGGNKKEQGICAANEDSTTVWKQPYVQFTNPPHMHNNLFKIIGKKTTLMDFR